VIDHLKQTAVLLDDGGLDDAIVHGPRVAVVSQSYRIVDCHLRDLRQHNAAGLCRGGSGSLRGRAWLNFGSLLRYCSGCHNYCQGK